MAGNGNSAGCEVLISSDSHVMEPANTLKERVAPAVPRPCSGVSGAQGGRQLSGPSRRVGPQLRIKEMEIDGVSAEVLYPTSSCRTSDGRRNLQEACFRAYNDWLIEYCRVAPACDWHRERSPFMTSTLQ